MERSVVIQAEKVMSIPVALIEAPADFPNRDVAGDILALQESLTRHGLLQPIIVRRSPKRNAYEIICGWRRYVAAKRNGWDFIQAIIKEDLTDRKLLSLRMVENLHRKDLEVHEKVTLLRYLHKKYGMSADDLALELRLSKSRVQHLLRLTRLPEDVLVRVVDGTHLNMAPRALTVSKALVLVSSGLPEDRIRLLVRQINQFGMSSKQLQNTISKRDNGVKLDLYSHRWENVRQQLRKLDRYCKIQGYECDLAETETCSTFKVCVERKV